MNLSDIILQQVTKNVAGSNIQIPSNVQEQVLGGLSDSILGSLTKTATAPGGIDLIKNLLTGKADAASSPITALAGSLFKNNVSAASSPASSRPSSAASRASSRTRTVTVTWT